MERSPRSWKKIERKRSPIARMPQTTTHDSSRNQCGEPEGLKDREGMEGEEWKNRAVLSKRKNEKGERSGW